MYRLVESIRIEGGKPMNLEYHQRRLGKSFCHFCGELPPPSLAGLIEVPAEHRTGKVKCRFLYCDDENPALWTAEFAAYTARTIRTLKLVRGQLDYSHKTADRSSLDELTARRGSCDDVIIIRDGLVTDTSFSNIVFLKGGRWYTPSKPLLCGTARAALLDAGVITERNISVGALAEYEGFRLINAMLPFETQPIHPMGAIKE